MSGGGPARQRSAIEARVSGLRGSVGVGNGKVVLGWFRCRDHEGRTAEAAGRRQQQLVERVNSATGPASEQRVLVRRGRRLLGERALTGGHLPMAVDRVRWLRSAGGVVRRRREARGERSASLTADLSELDGERARAGETADEPARRVRPGRQRASCERAAKRAEAFASIWPGAPGALCRPRCACARIRQLSARARIRFEMVNSRVSNSPIGALAASRGWMAAADSPLSDFFRALRLLCRNLFQTLEHPRARPRPIGP